MVALIIHGGAGAWAEDRLPAARAGLERALVEGHSALQSGSSAMDAVERAVMILEDDPVFDAGTGSHPNAAGDIEMDAIIVDGPARAFGAVAAIRHVRHPISVARMVLDRTPHCFLVGDGATRFAHDSGVPFYPANRLSQVNASLGTGTVGAVALDRDGRIAAATSTGGTRGKMPGRVGDSPLFGCGAYADEAVGVSATGQGEFLMRMLAAKTAADYARSGASANLACHKTIADLERLGGRGGLILLDNHGNTGYAFNTAFMPISYVDARGNRAVIVAAAEGPAI